MGGETRKSYCVDDKMGDGGTQQIAGDRCIYISEVKMLCRVGF